MPRENESIFNKSMNVFDPKRQKRKKPRIKVSLPAKFILFNSRHSPTESMIVDLGTGGLRMQAGGNLYQNDKILLEFTLNGDLVRINGLVARISGKDAIIIYQDLNSDAESAIQKYIHGIFFREDKKH